MVGLYARAHKVVNYSDIRTPPMCIIMQEQINALPCYERTIKDNVLSMHRGRKLLLVGGIG